jgi:P2-related tail formation protein
MKQELDNQMSPLERVLTQELSEVEVRIKELQDEAAALRRQIGKAAAKRQGFEFASRKNSLNRVLAENSVIEALRGSSDPLSSDVLFRKARQTNTSLKPNTFRTYLHRMKLRGVILTARRAGEWKLPIG